MNLVRIGDRMINMDLVTDIVREHDTVSLYFAVLIPQRKGPIRSPGGQYCSPDIVEGQRHFLTLEDAQV